jgi:CBS domain-containing protein
MELEDAMTTEVATVSPETSLKALAEDLAHRHISGMPVVTDDGEVVGVISEADLIVKEAGGMPTDRTLGARLFRRSKPDATVKRRARRVSDAMTSPAITIEPYRTVASAARTMLEHKIHRIPVVERGKLVGIITRADLIRGFARPGEVVLDDVRSEIRYRLALADDPGPVEVCSEADGVTLRGMVIRRSSIEGLVEAAAAVPGVIDVHAELEWRDDDSKPKPVRAVEGNGCL